MSNSWSGVDGDLLELRVSFLAVTLFFVSSEDDVLPLLQEGISRGRIWTLGELTDLFSIPNLTSIGRLTIATARAMFDGEVVSVTRCELGEQSEERGSASTHNSRGGELSERNDQSDPGHE
jgi:hypothetical protein